MSEFLATFIFFSVSFFSFHSNDSISNSYAAVAPTATPTPDERGGSFRMELDRDTFIAPCQPGYRCSHSDNDSAPFFVTVSSANWEGDFRYNYTNTGGRIIGEGAKVNWDLTGAPPGNYQITVAVADKAGNTVQTITKTITVLDYQDDGDRCLDACPELSVSAPTSPVTAGETMTFTANVSDGFGVEHIIYNWTVSDGKIIEGQGTPVIRVATNPKMAGKTVEATANFKWDSECWDLCRKTASASGSVAAKKRGNK